MERQTFDRLVQRQKIGEPAGLPSFCSAHQHVLQAVMQRGAARGLPVLVEATCNQVNQYGGYTGMTPSGFLAFVSRMAADQGLAADQLILGGDHLGPSVWQAEPALQAMEKAEALIRAYVTAGFSKLHIDASMHLGGDDPTRPLDVELIARRTAQLVKAAEEGSAHRFNRPDLWYVIGTDVPTPGGALEQPGHLYVTSPESVQETIDATYTAFCRESLEAAWERVFAIVVQPGVEFGDDFIQEYNPAMAEALTRQIEAFPNTVYEAHSTDYQSPNSLRKMVQNHFGILKVGPALTFAFREIVFSLAMIEDELYTSSRSGNRSFIFDTIEAAMVRSPGYWSKYYKGTPEKQAFSRKYSLSDRIRYYWPDPQIQSSLKLLFSNLESVSIPLTLLSQYMPLQYARVRLGSLQNSPSALVLDGIGSVVDDYYAACSG